MPLAIDPATASPGSFSFQSIGRLKKGAELDQVRARLAQVVQRLRDDSAAQATQGGASFVQFLDEGKYAPRLLLYKEQLVGDLRRPLWILLGTVGFVLLIACANVANLRLLGQGSEKAEHQPVFRFGFEQERLRRLAERGASGVAREFHRGAHHSRIAAIRAIGGPTVGKRTV